MGDDKFLHNPAGVSLISSLLKNNISDYKNSIVELSSLIEKIKQSGSWKDEQVKTSFINTCNSYITIYKELSSTMENYVSFLNGRSNSFSAFESAYTNNTRRG